MIAEAVKPSSLLSVEDAILMAKENLMHKHSRFYLALGSVIAYAFGFVPLHSLVGDIVGALNILPAAAVGLSLGLRAGLLFGLLTLPLNYLMYGLVRDRSASDLGLDLLSTIASIGIGTAFGWMKEILEQVKEQSRQLRRERQALEEQTSERQRAEAQLVYNAFHDPLTRLPNRALFMDRLKQTLERSKRHQENLYAVLYLDFDRFKVVNDSLGHDIGDQLLIQSARRLESCVRTVDTIARLGGDEFVILAEDLDNILDVLRVAERILSQLALPFDLNGHRVFISGSIGIVPSAAGDTCPEEFLRDADIAMYRAKALGKGRYEVFDSGMRARAVTCLGLETDLRRAVERQEFRIHYQPIVSLATNEITGFEALVRWQRPNQGLVYPSDFIQIAEESGLIIPIGQWVLREACRQMREWQRQSPTNPPLTISVNISAKQFSRSNFIQEVERVLQETGLDPHSLMFEITETMLFEDAEAAAATLAELRALGVGVQIDDFGTGYSSLGYLQRYPVDTLKIDRAFVGRVGPNGHGSEIVRAIVVLAHELGMRVVAEGVETADQMTMLKELKCEYGQGYLFAKPADAETFSPFVPQPFVAPNQYALAI